MEFPRPEYWSGLAFLFSRGFSQPRDRTQVSHIAGRFFTNWATREAQEYWSGSLSLLQQIFPTQELNQDLLHCRRILFQLSYEGSIYFVLMPAVVCSSLLAATRTKIAGPGLSLTSLVEALWHNTLQSSSRRHIYISFQAVVCMHKHMHFILGGECYSYVCNKHHKSLV